jgi:hypothetical protein
MKAHLIFIGKVAVGAAIGSVVVAPLVAKIAMRFGAA